MNFKSRLNLDNKRKLKGFPGRIPSKAVYAIFAVLVLLGGAIWYQMSGAHAATIDLINSTFEDQTDVVNWAVYGENNATVTVDSVVYNHTQGGSHSARVETRTAGAGVITQGGIKRHFTMPSGTINNVSLSVYYRNSSASNLNLKWEIVNADETGAPLASGNITTSASETSWTPFQVNSISGLMPSYNYVLRLYADGVTANQSGSTLAVDVDDVVLSAQYEAVPYTVNVGASVYSIPNNDITTTTVTATVYDQNGMPMNGQNVDFSKDQGWGTLIAPTSVSTDANGKASVQFKSDTGGVVRITATAGTKSNYADINVLYPGSLSISSSLATIPNNNTQTAIIARVLDQGGQPLKGVRVDFTRSPVSGTLTPSSGFDTTDDKGEAHGTFSSTVGGDYTITATVSAKSDLSPSASLSKETHVFVQSPGSLVITADKTVIPNDGTMVTVTAELKDQSAKPMNGEAIDFSVSPASGTLSAASAVTKSDGKAQITFKADTGATYTITGKVHRDTGITSSATVKVAAPTTLVLTGPTSSIPSDNKTTATVTATLKDQEGAVISGEAIDFSTNLGQFTGASTGLVTDTNGQVRISLKSASAGTATVTGTVHRLPGITGSVPVTIEAPAPNNIILNASKTSIPDDNSTTTTVTATVYDQYNHLLSGKTVTFSMNPQQGSFVPNNSTVTTDSDGKAAIQFESGQAGTYSITALCGAVSKNVTVNVLARVPNSLTLSASSAVIPDDGQTVTTITASLVDQFGNPYVNETVHFSKDSTLGSLSATNAVTGSDGKATVTYSAASPGTVVITASSGTTSDTQTITVQQRFASQLTLTASPTSILLGESSTIVAHLADQYGSPMPGRQIDFTTGLGKLSAVSAVTDIGGNATVILTSDLGQEKIGTTVVGGRVNGEPLVSGMVTVDFRSSDVTKPSLLKAEATSKQIFYLTFSEKIQFKNDPPTGWTLKKYSGETVTEVPISAPVILPGDRRIVRVALSGDNMDIGNQYPNPVRYEITVSDVSDMAGNDIDPNANTASFDAFTPHGKYAPYPVVAGNATRICAQCHSPHKAVGEKLLTAGTVQKVCFVCHGTTGMSSYKVQSDFYRGNAGDYSVSMHKALDSDSPGYNNLICVDCHVAHGIRRSGTNEIWPKLLRARNVSGDLFTSEDGNKFCLACHGYGDANSQYGNRLGSYWNDTAGDHSDGMTVSGSIYNSVHYDGGFAALKSSTSFENTCLSCHEEHGSKNEGLVDNNVSSSPEQLCYKCHNTSTPNSMNSVSVKGKFDATGGTTSKHNIVDNAGIGLSCRSCHEPHSIAARSYKDSSSTRPSDISDPTNTKNNWNKDSGNMAEFCIKCHNTNSGSSVSKIKNTSNLVPFTVNFPSTDFANSTGWNKSLFTNSAHYSNGVYCDKCHDPHGSDNNRLNLLPEDPPGAPGTATGECLRCHGGGETPAGPDVYSGGFSKAYAHPTLQASGKHSDTEDYSGIASADRHAECADCHDPHTAKSSAGSQVDKLGRVTGVKFSQTPWGSWGSATVTEITLNATNNLQAYLCYKCHSKYSYDTNPPQAPSSSGSWQSAFNQTDSAKEFNPDNDARHVVEGDSQLPSFTVDSNRYFYGKFVSSWSGADSMKCSDCHRSSDGTSSGPHGSSNRYILRKPWDQNTGKSSTEGDLCFNCHDYNFYAGNDEGSFNQRSQFSGTSSYNLHGRHAGAGCVSCHGAIPHGWNRKDSTGNGLSLFTTGDPQPYKDGVLISDITGPDTPGDWTKDSCVTSCHSTGTTQAQ